MVKAPSAPARSGRRPGAAGGTGPALTEVIDQGRESKAGGGLEAVSRCGTLGHPGGNDVRKIVPRQPRAILRIRYSSCVK